MPGPLRPDPFDPESTTRPVGRDELADNGGSGSWTSTSSIPDLFKSRAKSYAAIAKALMQAVGGWANRMSGEEDSGAFLPDADDLSDIPPPLGRLAARRIKFGADPSQLRDIEDIGMAAVGMLAWFAKGITATINARRERRRIEADKAVYMEEGNGQ